MPARIPGRNFPLQVQIPDWAATALREVQRKMAAGDGPVPATINLAARELILEGIKRYGIAIPDDDAGGARGDPPPARQGSGAQGGQSRKRGGAGGRDGA